MGFVALFYGTILYFIGFHNGDIGQNLIYLNAEYDLNLVDINSKFERVDAITAYISGSNMQRKGFFIAITGALLFGMSIGTMRFD